MFENTKPDFTGGYAFTRQVAGRERRIEVDSDMLTTLYGAEGPQTAAGIVEANLEFIDRLIADLMADGLADPESAAPIVISGVWYESEPDEELSIEEARERMKYGTFI